MGQVGDRHPIHRVFLLSEKLSSGDALEDRAAHVPKHLLPPRLRHQRAHHLREARERDRSEQPLRLLTEVADLPNTPAVLGEEHLTAHGIGVGGDVLVRLVLLVVPVHDHIAV